MAAGQVTDVMRYIRRMVGGPSTAIATDRQLLERYASTRDEGSFQAIVERHGPMVIGVCRRLHLQPHDAEDAFQATFLVLVRRARSIGRPELLGNWLYGVAYRVALEARGKATQWHGQTGDVPEVAIYETHSELERRELQQILDEELSRLPRKYRSPLVLCYLEGKTNEEAARELGWPTGTVFSRLARARELLRSRLARRGLPVTGALASSFMTQPHVSTTIPGPLLFSTLETAHALGTGTAVMAGTISSKALSLAEGVIKAMLLNKLKTGATCMLLATLFVVAGATLWGQAAPGAQPLSSVNAEPYAEEVIGESPPAPAAAAAAPPQSPNLKYGDGNADGKKSLGGNGEMIEFALPNADAKVSGLKIHGSRYGQPQAPDERFLIFFLSHDLSDVIRTEMAPYSMFDRGAERWVEVKFRRPVELPERFWVALDFRAGRTKGVYVSYDSSTAGKHSRVGLPGIEPAKPDFAGDWMIEVVLAK